MSLSEITLQGTLKADGTLDLDQKPNLAAGRVTIILRQDTPQTIPAEDWLEHLKRLRAKREANGYPFMNSDQVTTHIDSLRQEDGIDEILRDASQ